ncbi:hypothetical protein BDN72DRAFT_849746 [Pluteus cervinus]|uniref:Uncharacterized protein n=1 Tax=Pluteus cervinus TaxID=181527 RepID=A0ACD3A761_9AGAR|nr:hypothetical protein BDN72DRAFT_849746 [Pluteus cervinus]
MATAAVKGRRLVCCFDGTGNEFGEINSNIVDFFHTLDKGKPDEQLVYYQAGVGTYTSPLVTTPIFGKLAKLADEAVAWYLDQHVKDGYTFLMQTYRPGDKISLFGFSRGAYTARALAGMLHKVGLLPPHNNEQLPFAYKLYKRADKKGWELSEQFKKTFTAHNVEIDFVGVWDTVCSVGFIPYQLPFTSSNYMVKVFRQALSLDEHRAKFLPNTWNTPTARAAALGFQPRAPGRPKGTSKDDWEFEPPSTNITDVDEVWFSGCHADVGGGSDPLSIRLSRISLAWMIKQCTLTQTGILFDPDALQELNIDPINLTIRESNLPLPASKALEDNGKATDSGSNSIAQSAATNFGYAAAAISDQLIVRPLWWILEVLPLSHSFYHEGQKKRYISCNLGRGRYMYHAGGHALKIHNSVKERMGKIGGYKPNIDNFSEVEPHIIWVD